MINTGIIKSVAVCPISIYLTSQEMLTLKKKNHNAFPKNNTKIYDVKILKSIISRHKMFLTSLSVLSSTTPSPQGAYQDFARTEDYKEMTEITANFLLGSCISTVVCTNCFRPVFRRLQQYIHHVDGVPNRWPSPAGIAKDVGVLYCHVLCGKTYSFLSNFALPYDKDTEEET